MRSVPRLIIVCSLLVLLFAATSWAGPVSSKLTAAELARVKAGEVILKNNFTEKGDSGSGVAFGIIKGSVDDFWKVIFDHEHYMDFYPRLEGLTIVERNDKLATIEFKMDVTLTTVTYTTIGVVTDDRMGMTWTLDMNRPHKFFKKTDGYWKLEQLEPGVLLVEYQVDVALDFGPFSSIATKIVNSMAKDDLPDVIVCTRNRVESGGTWKRPKK